MTTRDLPPRPGDVRTVGLDPDWRQRKCARGGCGCSLMRWWKFCPSCGTTIAEPWTDDGIAFAKVTR